MRGSGKSHRSICKLYKNSLFSSEPLSTPLHNSAWLKILFVCMWICVCSVDRISTCCFPRSTVQGYIALVHIPTMHRAVCRVSVTVFKRSLIFCFITCRSLWRYYRFTFDLCLLYVVKLVNFCRVWRCSLSRGGATGPAVWTSWTSTLTLWRRSCWRWPATCAALVPKSCICQLSESTEANDCRINYEEWTFFDAIMRG